MRLLEVVNGTQIFINFCFYELKDDPTILDIMKRKTIKYTDHHIQNELFKNLGSLDTCVRLLAILTKPVILPWNQMKSPIHQIRSRL